MRALMLLILVSLGGCEKQEWCRVREDEAAAILDCLKYPKCFVTAEHLLRLRRLQAKCNAET